MLIDWFTVAAQIVNFLVLVGLMKHFLYKPLLHAIDSREQRIAGKLAEAEGKDEQAELKMELAKRQIAELESRGGQIIEEARQEAGKQRAEMVEASRESVQAQDARWREDLRREERAFFDELRRAAAAEILAIARRALADLASADLQRMAVLAFLEKAMSMDGAALKKLCGAAGLTVVSATQLPGELRRQVEETIQSRLGGAATLRFECAPEMGWGIELRGEGQRIGWTPDIYLESLEDKVRAVLDEQAEEGLPLAAG